MTKNNSIAIGDNENLSKWSMIDRKSDKFTGLIDSFLLTEETQVIFMHYNRNYYNRGLVVLSWLFSSRIITMAGFSRLVTKPLTIIKYFGQLVCSSLFHLYCRKQNKKALTNSSKTCRGSKSVRNFDDESISKSEKIDFILYVCRMPTGESISIFAWSRWFSSRFSTTESAIILSPKKRDCEIKIGEAWFGGWLMEMTHLPDARSTRNCTEHWWDVIFLDGEEK